MFQRVLKEKLKYAIHFCKSIDTDDYARIDLADSQLDDQIAADVIMSMTSRAGQAAQNRRNVTCRLLLGNGGAELGTDGVLNFSSRIHASDSDSA